MLGWGLDSFYIENGGQETFSNDYITGTTDVCTDNVLADVKTSFDATTFYPIYFSNKIDKMYYYQLQGYLWLTGKEAADLTYCLVNTPEFMLLEEIRREQERQEELRKQEEERRQAQENSE